MRKARANQDSAVAGHKTKAMNNPNWIIWSPYTFQLWPLNLNIPQSLRNNLTPPPPHTHILESHPNILNHPEVKHYRTPRECFNIPKSHGNILIPSSKHSTITRTSRSSSSTKQSRAPPKRSRPMSVFWKSLVLRRSEWCHSWDGDRKGCRKFIKNKPGWWGKGTITSCD